MNFGSDNAYGVLPQIMAAVAAAQEGAAPAYGNDPATKRLSECFSALFEREVAVFGITTGTAANALALATMTPPHGAILCHRDAHIMTSECGAPEFFSGAKLVGMAGEGGKVAAADLAAGLATLDPGSVHSVQPFTVSLSQASEMGTVYGRDELTALAKIIHGEGLKLHLDGARFANAMAHLKCSPAEATWKCGVDVMSFGASKGGALAAEAVIFFDPAEARDFEYRRKRAGHLTSKMRLVSAQLEAFVENGLWLESAARANALATRIGDAIADMPGIKIMAPVQTNMVFAEMPVAFAARIRAGGASFYDWTPPRDGRVLARIATSFATPEADVAKFIALVRG